MQELDRDNLRFFQLLTTYSSSTLAIQIFQVAEQATFCEFLDSNMNKNSSKSYILSNLPCWNWQKSQKAKTLTLDILFIIK